MIGHLLYVPATLIIGLVLGFLLGRRAAGEPDGPAWEEGLTDD